MASESQYDPPPPGPPADLDLTPQERAEKALQREREFTERLISSTNDGIFAFDLECRYTVWNPAMEEIFARKRDGVIGLCAFDVFPFLKATGEDAFFYRALAGQTTVALDRQYRLPELGREGTYEAHYSPIRDTSGGVKGPGKVVGGLAILQDISERKRAEESVRNLSGQLLRLQDEERRRIARELHDSTSQTLSAIALNLALLQKRGIAHDAKSRRTLQESVSLANQAAQEVRNLSHLLHPPDIDAMGLEPALRWYIARFAERSGIEVEMEAPPSLKRLSSEAELALFRVAQEALSNVHRHSGSSTAAVRISQAPGLIRLTIEDHGHGMALDAVDAGRISVPGVGVSGMRERLRQLGGSIDIVSGVTGTRVEAVLPLEAGKSGESAAER